MTLRMNSTERAYQDAKAQNTLLPLQDEPEINEAPEFKYWRIIHNRFPHDRHHTTHHLIVLKRDCDANKLSDAEIIELHRRVIVWAESRYDIMKLNMPGLRSIKLTPHYHLMSLKEDYK